MEKARVFKICGTRPDDVPESFEIYNAPRPLYGHKNWKGDFKFGVFCVAIDPTADFADEYRKATIQNAGVLLEWVNEEVAFQDQREWYLEHYPDTAGEIVDEPENRQHVIRQYFKRVNKKEE